VTLTPVLGRSVITGCGSAASVGSSSNRHRRAIVARSGTASSRAQSTPGQEVQVEIHNEGSGTHDFTIETLDLSTGPIPSGEVANATFTVPEGETPFECTLHPGWTG
jgi:hypothetical protein